MTTRKHFIRTLIAILVASLASHATAARDVTATDANQAPVLEAAGKVELPGYEGDFDHFEVDLKGNRLFLAAEDHNTLEVFDLKSLKHLKTIEGLETPHVIGHAVTRILVGADIDADDPTPAAARLETAA